MALLAIQGHSTRGKEVISYLKMLGGKNPYNCNGLGTLCAYRIIDGNIQIITIEDLFKSNEYTLYSLEGILAKFPYKVGNSVRLSRSNIAVVIKEMKWENDEIVYKLSCDDNGWWSVDNLKPYREETTKINNVNYCQVGKITAVCFQDTNYEDKVELQLGNNYEIKEENGKYYAVKKQFKYPKTHEECCEVLGCKANDFYTEFSCNGNDVEISDYEDKIDDLLQNFRKLRYYRDAYWKIAGKQMGLNEPWKPDWEDNYQRKWIIDFYQGEINFTSGTNIQFFLVFPTEEMRDAFYANFKELIEACKELL